MAAAWCTAIFYMLQLVAGGAFVLPTPSNLYAMVRREEPGDETYRPRLLMTIGECVESFLYGMGRIFPALIVLTLAWASEAIMIAVGADRLFSRWIVGGISAELLPTLAFLISFFMALATGTSWGTMSILFPLLLVPTYEASNGDAEIFYSVTAGVLSGSVAGDHISPISDTTVLSALACDCKLLAHVGTQAPYAVVVIILCVLVGTLPVGYGAWPNIVGILLGSSLLIAFAYLMCVPVASSTGRFDPITEAKIWWAVRSTGESPLQQLREDTVLAYHGDVPPIPGLSAKHDDDEDLKEGFIDDTVKVNVNNEEEGLKEGFIDDTVKGNVEEDA